jgi:hypothetical protein
MALKYWYVAGNGNSNFSTAGVWYNGPGGTGGVTTTPGAADDAILDAASGSGTLTIGGTSTCNSFNALTFTGTVAGASALNITTRTLINDDNTILRLGGTWNYTGTITFTTTISTILLYINCNGIFHKGNMTFNSAVGDWGGYKPDVTAGVLDEPIRLTGTLGISQGGISSFEVYAGVLSSSGSGVRRFFIYSLYLSGTGTLINASTQTNLEFYVIDLYITNTTATAKSLSIGNLVYFDNVYLQGSGASATSLTFAITSAAYPNVIISKTGGTFAFGTSYINDLTFIEGSTIAWAGSSSLTVYGNVTLCNSMSIITSNALIFAGPVNFNNIQYFTTFNKIFTGSLTVNDFGANQLQLLFNGNYISTSSSSSSISILSAAQVNFNGAVSTFGAISINAVAAQGFPTVNFFGGILTATNLGIADGDVLLGSTTLSGTLTVTSGNLQLLQNSVHSYLTFTSSSTSASRFIFLGENTIINLRGGAANTWNTSSGLAQEVLYLDPQTSTINITDNTSSQALSFQAGGVEFYNIHINRSNNSSIIPLTTFTGGFTCRNFRDFTVMPSGINASIVFAGGTTVNVYDTFQVGNDINQTFIASSSTTPVILSKFVAGKVICPRVVVYNMNAAPLNTWYAIKGSINNGGNNGQWIFNTPPRRLGSLGAG